MPNGGVAYAYLIEIIERVLDFMGYYRKFIRHYGFVATSLTVLLKKSSFVWSKEATKAFLQLKQVVTQPLVLKLPDFSKNFIIECDAFGVGLWAVLM